MFLLLIVIAAVVSLAICLRRLPAQNVFALTLIILLVSAGLEYMSVRTGFPFGQKLYHHAFAGNVFRHLPWPVPLIWLIILLNGRAVADLVLRSYRETKNYGYWLFALSSVLSAFLLFNFDWHMMVIRHDWVPYMERASMARHNNLRFLTIPVLLLLVTIWLINKKPERPRLDLYPALLWMLLHLYFAVAALIHRHFFMGGMIIGVSALTAFLAVRSHRAGMPPSQPDPTHRR